MVGYGVALGHARARPGRAAGRRAGPRPGRPHAGRRGAGTGAHRAGGPRHRGPRRERDRRAGGSRPTRLRRASRRRPPTPSRSIEAVGRDALDGLRRLMALLRTDMDDAGAVARSPASTACPGCSTRSQRAGLPVDLDHPRRAPPAAGDRGAERLPHRAGGADEHPQARRPDAGDRHPRLRGRACASRCATSGRGAAHESRRPATG